MSASLKFQGTNIKNRNMRRWDLGWVIKRLAAPGQLWRLTFYLMIETKQKLFRTIACKRMQQGTTNAGLPFTPPNLYGFHTCTIGFRESSATPGSSITCLPAVPEINGIFPSAIYIIVIPSREMAIWLVPYSRISS